MLVALLGLALAQQPSDLETRLLGPEPVDAPTAAAPAPSTSLGLPPWWTLPLAGLALGWAWTQRRRTEQVEADAMRVLGRTALGKDATVVLLEVRDATGEWRRLLVGSGGEGPQLITGLGVSGPTPAAVAPVVAAPMARRARSFAAAFEQEETSLESLPEVPAYPVTSTPAVEPEPEMSTMVESWTRDEEETLGDRPVLGPAGALAAAIRTRQAEAAPEAPPVRTEPPPVREPSPRAEQGMELLAEVRRARQRVGTRIQAYG